MSRIRMSISQLYTYFFIPKKFQDFYLWYSIRLLNIFQSEYLLSIYTLSVSIITLYSSLSVIYINIYIYKIYHESLYVNHLSISVYVSSSTYHLTIHLLNWKYCIIINNLNFEVKELISSCIHNF